jgi:hypothetical protein
MVRGGLVSFLVRQADLGAVERISGSRGGYAVPVRFELFGEAS